MEFELFHAQTGTVSRNVSRSTLSMGPVWSRPVVGCSNACLLGGYLPPFR